MICCVLITPLVVCVDNSAGCVCAYGDAGAQAGKAKIKRK